MWRLAVTGAVVLAAALTATACDDEPTAPEPKLTLAAYYPLDGDAVDVTGNQPGAIRFGATSAPDRFGNPAGALAFDGIDDYVATATTFDFAPRTVAFWFRLREHLDRYQRILVQNSDRLQFGAFGVGVTHDQRLDGRAGGNGTFHFGPNIEADRWYHIALVREEAIELYYVDGVLIAASLGSPGGSISTNTQLMLGSTRIPDRWFAGDLDDLYIYEDALSPENVLRLYQGEEPVAGD